MLETLNKLFNINLLIWLFPIIFIFHDLEEIITIEHFMIMHKSRILSFLPRKFVSIFEKRLNIKTLQFAIAVTLIFLILLIITFITIRSLSNNRGSFLLFTAALNVFFLHIFTHLGQTIAFRGYTPGIVTAVLLVLPYSVYTYYRLLEWGFIDWNLIYKSLPISLLILPILFIGHILGRKLVH